MTVTDRSLWGTADILRPTARAPHYRSGWVQVSAFVLCLGTWLPLLGSLAPALVLVGMTGVIASSPHQFIEGLKRSGPVLLIGAIAALSATWSTAPSISFRYGIQLAITMVAAISLASTLTLPKLLRVIFLAALLMMLICILSGRQGVSASGPVLIGLLGSKNEMGTLSQLLVCSAGCMFFQRGENMLVKIMALLGMFLGVVVLLFGFATGAVLSAFLFGGMVIIFIAGSRLSAGAKILLIFTLFLLVVPFIFIHRDIENLWEYFVVDVLHKDVGLTGRDYLWAHADRLIAERPLLGYGYRSTWLGSSTDTIGLLRWAGLPTGFGFHFHDNYREFAVDFGWLGAIVICGCFGLGFFKLIRQALSPGVTTALIFFASTAVVMIVRAKVEVVTTPFNSSTVLLAATAVVGYLQKRAPSRGLARHRAIRFRQARQRPPTASVTTRPQK